MDIAILFIAFYLLLKRKFAWVLFAIILLTTSYLGIGTNISEFAITHNVSDSGLILYLVLCFYFISKNKFKLFNSSLGNYIIIFYLFLLISFCVDLLFNNIDFVSIVKTSRHWIFLSCIWFFYYIPSKEVRKLINYLFNATVIISIIMLFEFFSGIQLLGKEYETLTSESGDLLIRGSIPSTFILFYLLLLFTPFYKFNLKTKYFYIILFSTVLITSVIRSWFLAIIFGIFIILILQKKLLLKNVFTGIVIITGLFLAIFNNPIIKERFIEGFQEVQNFNFINKNDLQGNFSFRILHMQERLIYISQSYQYGIFGLGNISEEYFPEIFEIGLLDESERVIQLDTADIAWSAFFLRLGLLGTFLYLFFFVSMLLAFYRIRKNNSLATTTFVYLFINLTIISFASSSIATGQFFLLPITLYFLSKKEVKLTTIQTDINKL